jgi:hypothetical protein
MVTGLNLFKLFFFVTDKEIKYSRVFVSKQAFTALTYIYRAFMSEGGSDLI